MRQMILNEGIRLDGRDPKRFVRFGQKSIIYQELTVLQSLPEVKLNLLQR